MTYVTNPKPVILSVDDDDGCAFLIRRNLEASWPSDRIEQFPDGHALLDFLYNKGAGKKCEIGNPYVVLLDIRMPKLNGIDLLRRLRSDQQFDTLPIIMLSTTDDPKEVSLCYQLGCNGFIRKPVDYREFAENIQRITDFITMLLIPPLMFTDCRQDIASQLAGSTPGSVSPFSLFSSLSAPEGAMAATQS